ncbi:MAG: D-arabinono-1,4-lactone oxidase [Cyanobacteria bacterium P01_D01_bin.44]
MSKPEIDSPGKRPVLKSAVGLYQFSPRAIAQPTVEADIVQAIRLAAQRQLRVRAIGAMHSAVPLPATEGLCLVLDKYNKILSVEGNLVTVQSGIRLWQLNDVLAEHGLALPILGTIAQQTVAGAISTGTHGGSLEHTSLSGYVQAMRIVRADGSVVEIDRTDDEFNGVAIALGALGMISTVTFQCVPAFSLQTEVRTLPMTEFLAGFDEIHTQNQYVDIRYSPICDRAHLALINPTPELLRENGGWQPAQTPPLTQAVTDRFNKLAQRLFLTHRFNELQRWGIERYDQAIYTEAYGRSDFVLTHFDTTSTDLLDNEARNNLDPVADMEVAIPYDRACEALSRIRDHFHTTQRFPSMHIHLRCSAAEPFWLSPTCGQPICWIEFWEYPCTGKFFQEMIELLAPFNPRGHWGKQLPISVSPQLTLHPTQQYKNWRDFMQLRQRWDPQGMFSNPYLDRMMPCETDLLKPEIALQS